MDGESGHILFRAFLREGEFTPQLLAAEISRYVGLIKELRASGLAKALS